VINLYFDSEAMQNLQLNKPKMNEMQFRSSSGQSIAYRRLSISMLQMIIMMTIRKDEFAARLSTSCS
jgi:hypothetical protein